MIAFSYNYGPLLLKGGPLFFGTWTVTADLSNALVAASKPVPAPVHGLFLLDTGASGTCISVKAADALQLIPIRMASGFGADGEMQSPIYLAHMHIPVMTPEGEKVDLNWGSEMRGVKDLEKPMGLVPFAGKPLEVVALLGRDMLQFTRFTYDGIAGLFAIEFDLTSMQAAMGGAPTSAAPPFLPSPSA
jgi:hypothetical protein